MDAARAFAKNAIRARYEDIPGEALKGTKADILDTLGTALAGSTAAGCREIASLVKEWGGKKESSIIYCKKKVPAPMAAQVNSTMGHALDYDDVHDPAVMHPGVVIIPVCMAVAERKGKVSGREFITAVALVRPDKLSGLTTKSVMKRFREKSFTAGVNRKQVAQCHEIGLELKEFISLGIEAMKGIASELKL